MKAFVFLIAATFAALAGHVKAQETVVRLEVVKFDWTMYDRRQILNEPPQINEEILNRAGRNSRPRERTIDEQSQELARIENRARKDATTPAGNVFFYELKVRNLDEKAIKFFIWEYQIAGGNDFAPPNASPRRFVCGRKIAAGDGKTLKFYSHLPPGNVVNASDSASHESRKPLALDVVIVRVGYADGAIWKSSARNDFLRAPDSPLLAEKLKYNDCAAL